MIKNSGKLHPLSTKSTMKLLTYEEIETLIKDIQ
jgi:hypothetical protein